MPNLLTWLSRRRFPYQPLIVVEILESRLLGNLAEFRKLAPKPSFAPEGAVAPVLKSNAYGHGLMEIARTLEGSAREAGTRFPFFVVDSYFEAVALRARHIHTPLLIIGYTRPETMATSRLRKTAFTISSLDDLRRFSGKKPPCPEEAMNGDGGKGERHELSNSGPIHVHLKIDTGMRRQGILPEEAADAISIIKGSSLVLEGICTHLCDADNADESFTDSQIHVWNRVAKQFRSAFPGILYLHASATDGHSFSADLDATVSRLGIGLYGLSENPVFAGRLNLKPALAMKTIVTGVKKLKAGETIGYGNTFKAMKDMTVATVPVGYFEGVDRRLSSGPGGIARGFIQIGPECVSCPIVGRVSMNISSVDVSAVPGIKIGDEAVVISGDPADQNSIAAIAKTCGTISYEIAVKIPEHLKRVVVDR